MTPAGEQKWREACWAYLRAVLRGASPELIRHRAAELARHGEWERHAD